jgi:hypothetical protein
MLFFSWQLSCPRPFSCIKMCHSVTPILLFCMALSFIPLRIFYIAGENSLHQFAVRKPCKIEDFASAAPRRWGGIGQSLRDSLQVELDPPLSSHHCTHLELNLAQCTLSKNDGAGTMFSSEKLFWDPVHNKALAQCTLSSSEHWLSAPCLHHSTRSVHPVIIRALVQCILPLSRHCLSATYRHRNFGSVHPPVIITALFQCIKSLSQYTVLSHQPVQVKTLVQCILSLQEVMSSLKAQVQCILSLSKYFPMHAVLIIALFQSAQSSLKHWCSASYPDYIGAWFSEPCPHHSGGAVHPVLTITLVQCTLSSL